MLEFDGMDRPWTMPAEAAQLPAPAMPPWSAVHLAVPMLRTLSKFRAWYDEEFVKVQVEDYKQVPVQVPLRLTARQSDYACASSV
jgi:hypothetical protein